MSEPDIVKTEHVNFDVELRLESGRLLGPLTLAYETYGQLNGNKSNAVLVAHAWTGDAHAAGRHKKDDRKPGWWDDMIGPGVTRAAQDICSSIPQDLREHHMIDNVGHYGIFNGSRYREAIAPGMKRFMARHA